MYYGPIMLEHDGLFPQEAVMTGEGEYVAASLAQLAGPAEILVASTLWRQSTIVR